MDRMPLSVALIEAICGLPILPEYVRKSFGLSISMVINYRAVFEDFEWSSNDQLLEMVILPKYLEMSRAI
jgi:hypothetical protein